MQRVAWLLREIANNGYLLMNYEVGWYHQYSKYFYVTSHLASCNRNYKLAKRTITIRDGHCGKTFLFVFFTTILIFSDQCYRSQEWNVRVRIHSLELPLHIRNTLSVRVHSFVICLFLLLLCNASLS